MAHVFPFWCLVQMSEMWVPRSRAVFVRVGENNVNDSRLFIFLLWEPVVRLLTVSSTILQPTLRKARRVGHPAISVF